MRVITVGTSNITREMIKAFKLAGVTVHACVSRALDRARDFAYTNGVKFYLSDYEKALTSVNFDTVYIAVPNSLHYEYAKKALDAGKNVIVEKPFCTNLEQANELFEMAKENNLFIFENMTTVHNPIMKTLKADLAMIGPVRYIEMNFYKRSRKYDDFIKGNNPPIFDPKMAGGALMDMNVYNIAFVLELFGMPNSISYHPNINKDIDVSGCAILHYEGFTTSLNAGKDAWSRSFACISGEKGHIYINDVPSRFNMYDIFPDGQNSIRRKVGIDDYLALNVRDFDYIMSTGDYNKYNEFVRDTLAEMKVLDSLRRSGKIKFD